MRIEPFSICGLNFIFMYLLKISLFFSKQILIVVFKLILMQNLLIVKIYTNNVSSIFWVRKYNWFNGLWFYLYHIYLLHYLSVQNLNICFCKIITYFFVCIFLYSILIALILKSYMNLQILLWQILNILLSNENITSFWNIFFFHEKNLIISYRNFSLFWNIAPKSISFVFSHSRFNIHI